MSQSFLLPDADHIPYRLRMSLKSPKLKAELPKIGLSFTRFAKYVQTGRTMLYRFESGNVLPEYRARIITALNTLKKQCDPETGVVLLRDDQTFDKDYERLSEWKA